MAAKYDPTRPLYLVDGSAFIFRAFHALPPLTRPEDGTPVGAVLGFANMLVRLVEDMGVANVAVIFDASRANFRNDIYPEYKANRSETPEDLIPQFPIIRETVRAFALPCIEQEGYEADDLIATYSRQAEERGQEVRIVSSDKDLMQLVSASTLMLDPMKQMAEIGAEQVAEKFGVPPEKVVDVQALAGDSVDNVPGVPGIGVKTAALLINEYDTLEVLLERAEEIKQKKRRENLIEFADKARVSKKLVQLEEQVPVEVPLEELAHGEPDWPELIAFLRRQGFRSIVKRLSDKAEAAGIELPEPEPTAEDDAATDDVVLRLGERKDPDYTLVQDMATLQDWIDHAFAAGVVAIDTETNSLTPSQADLIGISLAVTPYEACYIPLAHRNIPDGQLDLGGAGEDQPEQVDRDTALAALKPLLEDPAVLKVGQNLKYDWQVLSPHGIELSPVDDTMLLSYILDGRSHGHGMDELADLHLGETPIKYEEVCGKGKSQISFAEVELDKARDYAAEDADITLRLYKLLRPRLATSGRLRVHERFERPLIPIIARMEQTGIKVDKARLKEISAELDTRIKALAADVYALSDQEFNIGSPKQLGEVLFDAMGLPHGKKSKTGVWSTAQSVLEPLAETHEVVQKVLDWRGLSKLKSTYADALVKDIADKTGRIHSSFSMAVTNTGRLSSSDPNLQNIPIRTEEGRLIRKAFIPEDGHVLLSVDYSQIELRLVAEIADVELLKQAFIEGTDIHALTASQVFGVPLDEMTPDLRRQAKAINFGIIYGISAFGLANNIGVARGEAQAFIDAYFERFPELKRYMDEKREQVHSDGYVDTLYGRRIFLPGIKSKMAQQRQFAERQAINAPIQGTAADIIKKAMIEVDAMLTEQKLNTRMLLQVHDELVFEVPEAELETAQAKIVETMEAAANLSVPLIADAGHGKDWDEAH
ncbi:MAG: DNA polymerase I [Alphaproteobacteria bacterium]